jgi:excisionase family DNA binding protein
MTRPLAKLAELKEFLTVGEVCRFFNVHPNTLRNWDKSGKLKALRIGDRKDRRYKKDDVLSFFYGKPRAQNRKEDAKAQKQFSALATDFKNVKPVGNCLPIIEKSQK